jgi:hypothetical protein
MFSAVPAFAAASGPGTTPALSGGTGILTTPSAYTTGKGGLDLGFWWINHGSLAPAISFGITDAIEIGGGVDLGDFGGVEPIVSGRFKWRFSGKNGGQDAWALGLNFDMALGDNAADGSPDEIALAPYVANTFMVSGFQFSWGLGCTFGWRYHINCFVGISKMSLDFLYIDADFTNFSYRYNFGTGAAIGNIAVRFSLLKNALNLSVGLFNAFEEGREIGFGVSYKIL